MNSREVALNIINRVLIEGAYSNLVLSNELNESDLNEKDRALVTELVYGTIRRKKTLDMIISNYIKDISLMENVSCCIGLSSKNTSASLSSSVSSFFASRL